MAKTTRMYPGTSKHSLTKAERLKLIVEVYETFMELTEALSDPPEMGILLAYLLGEISRDGTIDVDLFIPEQADFFYFVSDNFKPWHPVMDFIKARGG